MPKAFKNMKAKAKQKATNYAAKKLYGADVIEAVAQDWWVQSGCSYSSLRVAAPTDSCLMDTCRPVCSLSAGFMDSLKTWMDAHQDEFSAGVGADESGMYPPQ